VTTKLRHPELAAIWSSEQGYSDYKEFSNGREACINRMNFTFAILVDLSDYGYGDHWCYHNVWDAMEALASWDGAEGTEPQGWHRHPTTGRRRPDGDPGKEYVNW
jgi:hypothetical protein